MFRCTELCEWMVYNESRTIDQNLKCVKVASNFKTKVQSVQSVLLVVTCSKWLLGEKDIQASS